MYESDIQADFNSWLRHNWVGGTAAFELKIEKTDALNFSAVKPHQIQGLQDAKHGMLVYKISDLSTDIKPFDSFLMTGVDAFVGVCYYKPRILKLLILIDIDIFTQECYTSKRKSLTRERAEEISWKVIDLTNYKKPTPKYEAGPEIKIDLNY